MLHGPTIKTYPLGPEDGLKRATDGVCLRQPDVLIANAPETITALEAAGAIVEQIPVYHWQVPTDHRPVLRLIDAVIDGRIHAVTFTSARAIRMLSR